MTNVFHIRATLLVVMILFLALSCNTSGDEVLQPRLGNIAFVPTAIDPLVYRVSLNNEVVLDNVTGQAVFPYKRRSDIIDLKIVDVVHNRIIFDSLYQYRPYFGAENSIISIFQKRPGSTPAYIQPSADETLPPVGFNKISFAYTYSDFPDSVKVVVEDVTLNNLLVYAPTDSFYIKRNEFSRFFLSRTRDRNNSARVILFSPSDPSIRLGSVAAFRDSFNDHNMYLAWEREGTVLKSEKRY